MSNDEPELTSEELLRQAREAFNPSTASSLSESPVTNPAADLSDASTTSREAIVPPAPVIPPPPSVSNPSAPIPGLDRPAPRFEAPSPNPPSESLGSESLVSDTYGSGSSASVEESAMPPLGSPKPPPPGAPGAPRVGATPMAPPSLGLPPVQRQQPQRAPLPPVPMKSGPDIPWRAVIGAVVVGGFLLIGAIAGRGTTSASRLGVGDCFANPGNGDFSQVTDQDCAGPHDIQIYAAVSGSPFSLDDFDIEDFDPSDTSSFGSGGLSGAAEKCDAALLDILSSDHMLDPAIVIPEDALLAELSDPAERFGEVLCAIESPSTGLVGSILP